MTSRHKTQLRHLFFSLSHIFLIYIIFIQTFISKKTAVVLATTSTSSSSSSSTSIIHIASIACGEKAVKHFPSFAGSLINNPSSHRVKLTVFADSYFKEYIQSNVTFKKLTRQLNVTVTSTQELESLSQQVSTELTNNLRDLPRFQCAYLKMFLSNLTRFQKLLYLDIDTIVLEDISHLWDLFRQFTSKQIMGMVLENATPGVGYYHGQSNKKHVYKGDGLNSGVILM